MFTGIIAYKGEVLDRSADNGLLRLTLAAGPLAGLAVGDSIAVNGVCLTAVEVEGSSIEVEVMGETLSRTNLGSIDTGDRVNLERPMAADGRFDGHLVQGHVDGVGAVEEVVAAPGETRVWISVPESLERYVVEKGSVTVDGVSLTVSGVRPGGFEVSLIPHTLEVTTLGELRSGDLVNLEVDILAKYVERLLDGVR